MSAIIKCKKGSQKNFHGLLSSNLERYVPMGRLGPGGSFRSPRPKDKPRCESTSSSEKHSNRRHSCRGGGTGSFTTCNKTADAITDILKVFTRRTWRSEALININLVYELVLKIRFTVFEKYKWSDWTRLSASHMFQHSDVSLHDIFHNMI